ncbi:MAG TPA: DUF1592 domain-containing protein [Pirellulaceae bacterium]|nr:DUF1592 domain-containing protein [Planctomycetales bacterium]HRX81536.1 DUF1592 domain-containing protein [Pirellulaceae bacterium]
MPPVDEEQPKAYGIIAITAETKRMLVDPKSRELVDNFAGQCPRVQDVSSLQPDRDRCSAFNDELRLALRPETKSLFENMIREDRNVFGDS